MININLMPWREEQRSVQQKQFLLAIAGAILVGLGVLAAYHWSLSKQIAHQNQRNDYLKAAVQEMDQEINLLKKTNVEKEQILNNLSLIQDLHNSKYQVVGVLDELVRLVPKQVHFTKIEREGGSIFLKGIATSNEKITQLMRNISGAKWVANPILQEINTSEKDTSQKRFTLVVQQRGTELNLSQSMLKRGRYGV